LYPAQRGTERTQENSRKISTHARFNKLLLGENDRNYTLGNRLRLSTWLNAKHFGWIEPTTGLVAQFSGKISGEDVDLKVPLAFPYPAPVTKPDLFGGQEVSVLFGVKLIQPDGRLAGTALVFGGSLPLYQSLNGPQPKETWRSNLALKFGF
jgi:hypothetical protein